MIRLPDGYHPPKVGEVDLPTWRGQSCCLASVGPSQLSTAGSRHPWNLFCTLPEGHDPLFHVAHDGNWLVLAVSWHPDAKYMQLPEGL